MYVKIMSFLIIIIIITIFKLIINNHSQECQKTNKSNFSTLPHTVSVCAAFTAISIYVVGSNLQAYATRPIGGMDRLKLILGFVVVGARWTRRLKLQLYGRGIVNFADNYSLRSHIQLRSCLVGLRL